MKQSKSLVPSKSPVASLSSTSRPPPWRICEHSEKLIGRNGYSIREGRSGRSVAGTFHVPSAVCSSALRLDEQRIPLELSAVRVMTWAEQILGPFIQHIRTADGKRSLPATVAGTFHVPSAVCSSALRLDEQRIPLELSAVRVMTWAEQILGPFIQHVRTADGKRSLPATGPTQDTTRTTVEIR
jgi:hypothetical protein